MRTAKAHGRAVLVVLSLLLSLPLWAAEKRGRTASSDNDLSGIVHPELVNAQSDPTLRFPVMNLGGAVTYGWLDISSNAIIYSEVVPGRRSSHSFSVSRFAIANLRFNGSMLSFKSPKKLQMLTYVPQNEWGKVHLAFGGWSREASRESMGTESIYKTLTNFGGVLALVKPPAPPPAPMIVKPVAPPPPPKPVAPASPPVIVLSSPAGAGDHQTLEVQESSVVIRGVAMDSAGIPVVRINGSPANMRPQTPQAAEFWSEPVSLQAGSNHLEIVASNSAHLEAKVDVTVDYKPKVAEVNPRALDRPAIVELLEGGVSPERIEDLIKDRGVKFSATTDNLDAIRAAGGNDDLISAIRQAAPQP